MSLIENKKARFNYEILETLEVGIELLGHEVKSIREKLGSLEGARVIVRGGEAFMVGATIPPYQPKNTDASYVPDRNRKLLLAKKEIIQIADTESKKGLTIVPLSVYNKGKKIKVSIGIVRGKKKHDKRETIKKRETDRDIRRSLKNE
jgi:SsrA-binding protein